LRAFIAELGHGVSEPTSLSVDNQAALDLAYNPEHHQRTKHINRRHFYVREAVEELQIVVPYVPTDENVADFFTKALPADKFYKFRARVMGLQQYSQSPTPGGSALSTPVVECGGVSHDMASCPRGELSVPQSAVPGAGEGPHGPVVPGPKRGDG